MMNFLSNLTPNQMMLLGAALFGSPIALSNDKVKAWVKDKTGGFFTTLGTAVKKVFGMGKTTVTPLVAPAPSGIVIDSPLAVHQIVTPLMAFFAQQQDKDGVDLAGAVGQHMYDRSAKWMSAGVTAKPETSAE